MLNSKMQVSKKRKYQLITIQSVLARAFMAFDAGGTLK